MAVASSPVGPVLAGPLFRLAMNRKWSLIRLAINWKWLSPIRTRARKIEMATAAAVPAVDVPDKPHQPLTFTFPERCFGKKSPVFHSFQPSWFSQ